MLAVTFSGGDKMMRSIVSTCVSPVPSWDSPGDSQDITASPLIPTEFLCEPGQGCAFYPGPAQTEGGSCFSAPLTPAQPAPLALPPGDAGAQRAGRALGFLSHLAPASPLFWHVGLSQLNF